MPTRTRTQKQRAIGKGSYPSNWPGIARRVKVLAGWRCERCRHPHETSRCRAACDEHCSHPCDGKQRMLTVHHLDMNPANNAIWNLVALCQACHLSIQVRVDFEQSWMFDDLPGWLDWRWNAFSGEMTCRLS